MSDSLAHSDLDRREPLPPDLVRLRGIALIVGIIAAGLWILGLFLSPSHAFRSYLFAYLFWISISLGSLTFVMISHMTGGEWGVIIRRFGETAAKNLPLMLLFFIPLIFGYKYLFPWAHMQDIHEESVLQVMRHRENLYNSTAFTVRNFLYFAIWIAFMWAMVHGSRKLDHLDSARLRRRLRKISAGGVVIYFATITFFGMDFIMSRETHYYSSVYGFIIAVGQGAAGMSFLVLAVCYFANRTPIKQVLRPGHLNDLGNLLLTLVILWAYTSFAELLVIWTGNTKEDIGFFAHRGFGMAPNAWRWVALALVIGHFFAPFFLLLMKGLKRKVPTLASIAALLLAMRIVDNLWLTAPSGPLQQRQMSGVYWTDIVAWLGMGGIWLFVYLWMLARVPLLPQNASDQPEILTNGIHAANTPHAG